MTETIASTNLETGELATLDALLEVLIPADAERELPSARGMPVLTRFDADQTADLKAELRLAEAEAQARCGESFAAIDTAERALVVREVLSARPFFRRLMHAALTVYYMDDRVMTFHGLAPHAPFPEGNEVESGDFELLAPVRAREPFYRPV